MAFEECSTFSDRHLSGTSYRGSEIGELVEGSYDYLLMGSSWDRRCLSLTTTKLNVEMAQLFLPQNAGTSGLRKAHDAVISSFVRATGISCDVIEEHSEDLSRVFQRIEDGVTALRKELNRPIRMLVDLSAMARYFTLGAIALGLNDGIAEYVDVVYSEAIYGDVIGVSNLPIPEFVASWEATAVPRLEGDWYPDHLRHFLVSIGFEAAKIARLTERWDPDRVSVLFPSPGVLSEYESVTRGENETWMRQSGVNLDDVIYASPSDAVSAWAVLSECDTINPSVDNIYCLLSGTKPHGLGLSLYSMARDLPAVMYIRPTVHEEKEIESNGVFWKYRLRDRSAVK